MCWDIDLGRFRFLNHVARSASNICDAGNGRCAGGKPLNVSTSPYLHRANINCGVPGNNAVLNGAGESTDMSNYGLCFAVLPSLASSATDCILDDAHIAVGSSTKRNALAPARQAKENLVEYEFIHQGYVVRVLGALDIPTARMLHVPPSTNEPT